MQNKFFILIPRIYKRNNEKQELSEHRTALMFDLLILISKHFFYKNIRVNDYLSQKNVCKALESFELFLNQKLKMLS